MGLKKLLTKSVIAWGISSVVIAGILVTANVLTRGNYKSLLDQVLGGQTAILDKSDNGIDFGQEFFTKKDAYSTLVYYVVSKSTDDGSYNEGTYEGQIGEACIALDAFSAAQTSDDHASLCTGQAVLGTEAVFVALENLDGAQNVDCLGVVDLVSVSEGGGGAEAAQAGHHCQDKNEAKNLRDFLHAKNPSLK